MQRITLWDLPLRLFHWSLLALVVAAFVSVQIGGNAMVWHGRFGTAILGLLAFRLVWGVIGSTYARFSSFVRGPWTIAAYLRGEWQGAGHNPLGALSVLGMLSVLSVQVVTGLFANDDIAFQGPYAVLISNDNSIFITGLHKTNVWLLGGLIAAHLAAIFYYVRIKRDNLLKPMVVGYKEVEQTGFKSAVGGGVLAVIAAVLIGIAVAWFAQGGLAPYLAPPPPIVAEPLF
jgi:cytochrome b